MVRTVGEYGVLVEFADNKSALALFTALDRRREELRLLEVIPGHHTVLVVGRASRPDAEKMRAIAKGAPIARSRRRLVTIVVDYDGCDLAGTAETLGLSVDELVHRHTAAVYTVGFLGFAPGFAYLVGGDPRLELPRRPEPRERVPSGSVAIAGEYSTVYPTASPGGWHLLGRADLRLFDVDTQPPSLLTPGDSVRFVAR